MSVIEEVAKRLGEIRQSSDDTRGNGQFLMAKAYCEQYDAMARELRDEGEKSPTPQKINRRIRAVVGYAGPGSSFLSNAKRTFEVFPQLFIVNDKKRYADYKDIANARLPDDVRAELVARLEAGATQAEIRQAIREASDASRECDFKVQVSNCWRFGKNPLPATFDGGIHPELVANLIHHFSDAGEHIVDPMAGGGTTRAVVDHYRWFREEHPEWPVISGPRTVEMFDAAPTSRAIRKHNILLGKIPAKRKADLVVFDPPYWGIAEGKYASLGSGLDEWLSNIGLAFKAIASVLADGGRVCAVVDDFQRAARTEPLFFLLAKQAEQCGLRLAQCVYNAYPNYIVSMGAAQMHRCKKSRVLVNEMKTIGVFVAA